MQTKKDARSLIMGKIHYLKGDATCPQGKGSKIIVHICNDIGAWGAGFVLAVSKKWQEPESTYRQLSVLGQLQLGQIQIVQVESDIVIVNMIAQRGIHNVRNKAPIRYAALQTCLKKIAKYAREVTPEVSIHMPRIGCGLAGGNWNEIEKIVLSTLSGFNIYVYDLQP